MPKKDSTEATESEAATKNEEKLPPVAQDDLRDVSFGLDLDEHMHGTPPVSTADVVKADQDEVVSHADSSTGQGAGPNAWHHRPAVIASPTTSHPPVSKTTVAAYPVSPNKAHVASPPSTTAAAKSPTAKDPGVWATTALGNLGPAGSIHQVLFFPDEKQPCRNYMSGKECRRPRCDFAHSPTSLSRMLLWLSTARRSLDICVFSITNSNLAQAIISAKRRGVAVRMITDDDQSEASNSDIKELIEADIDVRDDHSPYNMHDKFCIIDGRVLMNGSFNWTVAAAQHNRENVHICDTPGVVQAFQREFEHLWTLFGRFRPVAASGAKPTHSTHSRQ